MSSTRCNSPTAPQDLVPMSDSESPHFEKASGNFDGDEDNTSQCSYPSSPAPPSTPPALIKKEKHPPEEVSDTDFPTVETYLTENPDVSDAPKEDPKPKGSEDEESNRAEPFVVSTSITTTHVKDLHELCQSHVRFTPVFDFEQRKPQEFSVVLKLLGPTETKEIRPGGVYPSKRHAKEAASGLGIEYVKSLPKGPMTMETPEKNEENWVGLLSDMCTIKKTRPQYIDYGMPAAGFSCEIRLSAEFGIPGIEDKVFGDKHKAYKNKRSAKVAAAKAAMLWIQEHAPPSPAASTTSSSKKSGKLGKSSSKDVFYPKGSKTTAIVNHVCPRLGIMTPEYHLVSDPRSPSMYDVTAIIKRPNGPRDLMIGPLKSIFGKKKAKEEMANGVYNWLKKEAERQGVGIYEEGTQP